MTVYLFRFCDMQGERMYVVLMMLLALSFFMLIDFKYVGIIRRINY